MYIWRHKAKNRKVIWRHLGAFGRDTAFHGESDPPTINFQQEQY
ncbi:hypothetical protein L798_04123 [Zootermopsis nevadensis]|uniref:Uncharacterized protein n=1 Tax=Zootermopsis nevadensis TaxID=136037 RepID=A0A067RB27_ZOONE|nr:hypothetical protein L798_04123 [Zootermopsis nevadensis]